MEVYIADNMTPYICNITTYADSMGLNNTHRWDDDDDDDDDDVTKMEDILNEEGFAETPRFDRVDGIAEQLNIVPGLVLDFSGKSRRGQRWDCSNDDMKAEALRLVEDKKGLLNVGSPLNTWLLRDIDVDNMADDNVETMMVRQHEHLKFCLRLHRIQSENKMLSFMNI